MTTPFPVPLDTLISYVQAQQQQSSPLDELAAAVVVAERLDEQADALIGHFVDRARNSGASWSQIGASMGVSKQAAQKRFVPRWDDSDPIPEGQLFSRFTMRARNVVAMAQAIVGPGDVSADAIVVGLLSEPNGLAAEIMRRLGATDEKVSAAFGLQVVEIRPDADPVALRRIAFADDATALLRGTLQAALTLGHNYVGTEHLLLGCLLADGEAAKKLGALGLSVPAVEVGIAEEIARIRASHQS